MNLSGAIALTLDDDELSEDIDFLRNSEREADRDRSSGGDRGGGGYGYAESGRARRPANWRRSE